MNFSSLRAGVVFLFFASAILMALESCKNEEEDFTSGSFYPDLGEPSDTTGNDTSVIVETGC